MDSAAIERTLLLTHHPEFVDEFARLPVDVVFAGHTHGGQVRIPYLLNGLYATNQWVFLPFAGGIYELMPNIVLKDTSITHNPVHLGNLSTSTTRYLVVSCGISLNWLLPHIFNPPEIV